MRLPKIHPALSEIYRWLQKTRKSKEELRNELRDLALDIAKYGQREPCVMWNGYLLDGRNRWRACSLIGVDPKIEHFSGDAVQAIDLIVSHKMRDDLTLLNKAQLAFLAAALIPFYETAIAEVRHGEIGSNCNENT